MITFLAIALLGLTAVVKQLPPSEVNPLQRPRLRHGLFERSATALRLRERSVRQLCQKAKKVMPWLQKADYPALRSWAELEVVAASIFANLMGDDGFYQKDGEPRRVLNVYRQFKLAQLAFENALMMTPASRVAITKGELPIDIAQLASEIEDVVPTDTNGSET